MAAKGGGCEDVYDYGFMTKTRKKVTAEVRVRVRGGARVRSRDVRVCIFRLRWSLTDAQIVNWEELCGGHKSSTDERIRLTEQT